MTETGTSRKERERLSRKNEIIAAAREVFSTRGFNEATLEEIASKAEFGKGTLYNYFHGKDDLYTAVMVDCFDECQRIAEETLSLSSSSFRENTRQFASGLLLYFYGNLGIVSLLMREMHMPKEQSLIRDRFAHLVEQLENALERAMETGEIKRCNTRRVSFLFIAIVFSLFHHTMYHNCIGKLPDCMGGSGYSDEEIHGSIEEVLELLDITFYTGILHAPVPDHSHNDHNSPTT